MKNNKVILKIYCSLLIIIFFLFILLIDNSYAQKSTSTPLIIYKSKLTKPYIIFSRVTSIENTTAYFQGVVLTNGVSTRIEPILTRLDKIQPTDTIIIFPKKSEGGWVDFPIVGLLPNTEYKIYLKLSYDSLGYTVYSNPFGNTVFFTTTAWNLPNKKVEELNTSKKNRYPTIEIKPKNTTATKADIDIIVNPNGISTDIKITWWTDNDEINVWETRMKIVGSDTNPKIIPYTLTGLKPNEYFYLYAQVSNNGIIYSEFYQALGIKTPPEPSGNMNDKKEKEVIKIGAILPLTGPAAVYGEQAKSGQQKAVDHLNKNVLKDKTIEIIYEDGKADPKESVIAYQKLRSQNINIFTTTISSACLAIIPPAKTDGVLLFADAAHPQITNPKSNLIFRHSNTTTQEAELIFKHINNATYPIVKTSIAIIYMNDEYGMSVASESINNISDLSKIELVFVEDYEKTEKDFSTLVLKLRMAKPDIIVLIGYGQNLGILIKKIREYKLSSNIIASIGFIITGADKTAGDAAKGIEYVNFDFQKLSASNSTFVNSFEALEYGTILLLGKAINEKGDNPLKIAEYISGLKTFSTGVEEMSISPSNDILPKLKIDKFK